jgi:hypothetical protein
MTVPCDKTLPWLVISFHCNSENWAALRICVFKIVMGSLTGEVILSVKSNKFVFQSTFRNIKSCKIIACYI